jgi:hypothetical protein
MKTYVLVKSAHEIFVAQYPIFVYIFSGEGPRSRRYGRTAAMRLLVQPCDDDDDDDDDSYLSFSY